MRFSFLEKKSFVILKSLFGKGLVFKSLETLLSDTYIFDYIGVKILPCVRHNSKSFVVMFMACIIYYFFTFTLSRNSLLFLDSVFFQKRS